MIRLLNERCFHRHLYGEQCNKFARSVIFATMLYDSKYLDNILDRNLGC